MNIEIDCGIAAGLRDGRQNVCRPIYAVVFAIAAVGLSGCSTPAGNLTYYLPKAETVTKVTQTLACNAKGDTLVQVVTVSSATTYSSDFTAKVSITPRLVDGLLSNADIAFNFTNDGRLSGVNVKTIGQGGEVVKGILAVAKAAGVFAVAHEGKEFDAKLACEVIGRFSAKVAVDEGKTGGAVAPKAAAAAATPATAKAEPGTVTLVYETKFDYERLNTASPPYVQIAESSTFAIPADASSAQLFDALVEHIPGLGFQASVVEAEKLGIPVWEGADTNTSIKLNRVANAIVQVTGLKGNLSKKAELATFWRGEVYVPLTLEKDLFNVPIPKAAVFGSRTFVLALTDYGSISKIQYASTNSVTETAVAAGAIGSAVAAKNTSPSVAAQVDAEKLDADLIYQQNRKATCLAKPESCSK